MQTFHETLMPLLAGELKTVLICKCNLVIIELKVLTASCSCLPQASCWKLPPNLNVHPLEIAALERFSLSINDPKQLTTAAGSSSSQFPLHTTAAVSTIYVFTAQTCFWIFDYIKFQFYLKSIYMAAVVVRIRYIIPIQTISPKWSNFWSNFDFWSEF